MTRWQDIKFMLDQASPEDLAKPAQVYSSLFGRLFDVRSLDHLDTYQTGKRNDPSSPLVMVIDNATQ